MIEGFRQIRWRGNEPTHTSTSFRTHPHHHPPPTLTLTPIHSHPQSHTLLSPYPSEPHSHIQNTHPHHLLCSPTLTATFTFTHKPTSTPAHLHKLCTYKRKHKRTHIHTHARTRAHTSTHIHIQTFIQFGSKACIHAEDLVVACLAPFWCAEGVHPLIGPAAFMPKSHCKRQAVAMTLLYIWPIAITGLHCSVTDWAHKYKMTHLTEASGGSAVETHVQPSGLMATQLRLLVCPSRTALHFPVAKSHTLCIAVCRSYKTVYDTSWVFEEDQLVIVRGAFKSISMTDFAATTAHQVLVCLSAIRCIARRCVCLHRCVRKVQKRPLL